jgi:hypothetical protein
MTSSEKREQRRDKYAEKASQRVAKKHYTSSDAVSGSSETKIADLMLTQSMLISALEHIRKMFDYITTLRHIDLAQQQAEQGILTVDVALSIVDKEEEQ